MPMPDGTPSPYGNALERPCIQAPGLRRSNGYAMVSIGNGKEEGAHRAAYRQEYGEIPDGLHIDHLCHNLDLTCSGGNTCVHRGCIEPTHLEAVTPGINVLRGRSPIAKGARKAHCNQGHEFTPENTHYPRRRPHHRQCRTCLKGKWDRFNDARSAAARERTRCDPTIKQHRSVEDILGHLRDHIQKKGLPVRQLTCMAEIAGYSTILREGHRHTDLVRLAVSELRHG